MANLRQLSAVLLLLGMTGCATTRFQVTSEPSGASVSVREAPLLYPFLSPKWVDKGKTPCSVVTTMTSWRPAYPPLAFRVSHSNTQTRVIEIERERRPFLATGAAVILICLPGGYFAALMGGSAAAGALYAGGSLVAAGAMLDKGYYYPQRVIPVDFNIPDPHPNAGELLPGWQRLRPPPCGPQKTGAPNR